MAQERDKIESMNRKAILTNRQGFSQIILLGIITVLKYKNTLDREWGRGKNDNCQSSYLYSRSSFIL